MPPKQAVLPPQGKAVQSAEDMRKATASVEVRLPDALKSLFYDVASDKDLPESYRAAALESLMGRSRGSGFAVQNMDGQSLIITNEHVVDDADEAYISFDSGKTHVRGEVLYTSPEKDVAVVLLPVESTYIFRLSTEYKDLGNVIALGNPVITRDPSYQVTRGVVSNHCFKMPDWESKMPCLIQHTASINPGSSGGPLIRDEDHSVIGINSYYFSRRNNVYLSVPANEILDILKRAKEVYTKKDDRSWMEDLLQKTCERFFQELSANEPIKEKLPFLSHQMMAENGRRVLYGDWRPYLSGAWFAEYPTDGLNMAVLKRIRSDLGDLKGPSMYGNVCRVKNPNDDVLKKENVRVRINLRDGVRETAWRFEAGSWRLVQYWIPKEKKEPVAVP